MSLLEVNHIDVHYGDFLALKDVSIHVEPGTIVSLIGANGAGKSTFLKILSGQLEPTNGSITMTPGQRLSVLEQDHFKYDDCVVLDTVMMGNARLFEIMKEKDAIYAKEDFSDEDGIRASELEAEFAQMNGWEADSDAASLLNGLGIETDLHYKKMGELDGPDKVKVLLARALFGNPDILLMDEPTNHLDIASKEILENALNDYTGTVLYVSHDRYFINQTASRILDLVNHTFVNYIGNYDYYLEKKEELTTAYAGEASTPSSVSDNSTDKNVSESKLSWQEQKEAQARLRKRQNELKKTEERIGELEDRDSEIDALMIQEDIFTNSVKCQELAKEKAAIAEELEELYMKWEELAEDA